MILLPLLALASFSSTPQDITRLRTVLPNGAVILVERVPDAPMVTSELFLSSRGTEESPSSNGYRHLLEHLIATGKNGDLDTRLESQSLELIPRTLRDAMVFQIDTPPSKLQSALNAFSEIAKPRTFDQATIDREVNIIRQEGYFRPWTSVLGEAAWSKAYGERGGDPFGAEEAMKTATPERLAKEQQTMFGSRNTAIVISGDVDLDLATAAARKLLELWPDTKEIAQVPRKSSGGGFVKASAEGVAVGIPVATYRDPSTAASLAVALYLASQLDESFVTYTPSSNDGMIVVGTHNAEALNEQTQHLDSATVFYAGKDLAKRWVQGQLTGAANIAFWRGLLLVQSRDLKPETLSENIETLTQAKIQTAIDHLQSDAVVHVVGER